MIRKATEAELDAVYNGKRLTKGMIKRFIASPEGKAARDNYTTHEKLVHECIRYALKEIAEKHETIGKRFIF
jgi:hypothetical protein